MGRFSRLELLLGARALAGLTAARVTVVGLGAVGSYAVEGLARAGVGNLRLVDFDEIRESNINRQLYALDSTLGRPKAEVAAERVRDINPDCRVETMPVFVDTQTVTAVLDPRPDVLIDAIDSVGPKLGLLHAAVTAAIPVVSVMGAASRMDPAALRVGDISETSACPLARHIRKKLRQAGVATGIRCVYSVEPVPDPPPDHAPETDPESSLQRGRQRRPIGSFSCLTGIFGLTAARETIMLLLASSPDEH